jgi:hypothetical protein
VINPKVIVVAVIPGALAVLAPPPPVVGEDGPEVDGELAVVPGLAVVAVLEPLLELHADTTSAPAPTTSASLRQDVDIGLITPL